MFGRWKKGRPGTTRTSSSDDLSHLDQFLGSRSGVEAYLEPRTTVTESTVVLIAADGEWTRRRIDGPEGAASWARRRAVPLYDVTKIGYPQRMRDWTASRRNGEKTGPPGLAGPTS